MSAEFFARGALLLLDKPEGLTSHDVVERARRASGVAKIGHSGTLDPMATGLLVLCCGKAARLQGFFTGLPKSYEGSIALGRATATYDREGETTSESSVPELSPEAIQRAADAFRGRFEQLPPPFSAKKSGGRRFYEMARKGEEVPRLPKTVTVTELTIERSGPATLAFRLSCSSGTYVRSIAHDLGKALGCGAHLAALRRTRIGDFVVADALPLDAFERAAPELRASLPHAIPLSKIPFPFPRMPVASLEAWKVRRGQPIPARLSGSDGDWVSIVGGDDELLALGQMTPVGTGKIAMIKPKIVLAD